MDSTAAAYETFQYENLPFRMSHPDWMRTLGILAGLEPAPIDSCRVLEIGCAHGGHLLPLAELLPGSEFVGFDLAASQIEPTPHVQSISADGIAISQPVRWRSLLEAIRFSRGRVLAVNEAEVLAAHAALAARGIFVEPTSATVAAALQQLPASILRPNELVVGILTGHGLKKPPKFEPL